MKQLIITIIIILTVSIPLYSQNSDKHGTFLNFNQSTYEAYMTSPQAFRYFEVPAQKQKGFTSVASTSADTLSRKIFTGSNSVDSVFSFWYQFSILTDDTLQISHSAAFGSADIIIVLPSIPFTSVRLDATQVNNLYYKVYGTGTPSTIWSLFGY
ncbi:MAG: hypothetical protein IPM56_11060 [Ignavibacteriales bacterium]|nr:MAG: hypothetical protein IPM56_11060 [Ignavibacteriales bacterium]